MAIAYFGAVLGVGSQHVEENILARFDRFNEWPDLLSSKSPLNIKADLLLDPEVVNGALLEVIDVR